MYKLAFTVEDIKALSKKRARFHESLEHKVIPKVEADIEVILANGWADSVSPQDLYHCHVAVPRQPQTDIKVWEKWLADDHIQLLYHSREHQSITHDRNIVSSLKAEPKTINGKRTLKVGDLNSWDACQINFGLSGDDLRAQGYSFERVLKRGRYYFGISPNF